MTTSTTPFAYNPATAGLYPSSPWSLRHAVYALAQGRTMVEQDRADVNL